MTPETSKKLTLFDLERDLVELMEFSAEAQTEEEQTTALRLIGEYLEMRADKVDAIRGYLKHCEMTAACAREEAAAQSARAKAWEARAQRLKDACVSVMQSFGEKRLQGRTGDLKVQANQPAVEVYDVSLLPPELCNVDIRLSGKTWAAWADLVNRFRPVIELCSKVFADLWYQPGRPYVIPEWLPDKKAIAEALKRPCAVCDGGGKNGLATLETGGERVALRCGECNGTGHQLVPGARLLTDKQHLRIT